LQRIKEARALKGRTRQAALALVEWRESRAAKLNCPVRQVLSDLAIVTIAQRMPRSEEQLHGLRGLDSRSFKRNLAAEVLRVVALSQKNQIEISPATEKVPEVPRSLRPAVALISSWISQLAREQRLDPAILATRSDIEAVLRGDKDNRLNFGWRAALVGSPIEQLLSGEAAIAFDKNGGLVMESRSYKKL
jgi:ribonuclease D